MTPTPRQNEEQTPPPRLCKECGSRCKPGNDVCEVCIIKALKRYGWMRDGVLHDTRPPLSPDDDA